MIDDAEFRDLFRHVVFGFAPLPDENRRPAGSLDARLFVLLADGESHSLRDLARAADRSPAQVCKRLGVLLHAGSVVRYRSGRKVYYSRGSR